MFSTVEPRIGQVYHVEVEPPDGPLVIFDAALIDYDKVDEADDVFQALSFSNDVTIYTGGSTCVHLTEAERWAMQEFVENGGSKCRAELTTEDRIAFPPSDCRN